MKTLKIINLTLCKHWNLCLALLTIGYIAQSCGKTRSSYIVRGEFNYINKTDKNLQILFYGPNSDVGVAEKHNIEPNDTLKLATQGETDFLTADPEGYLPAVSGDTTILIVYDTLCYSEYFHKGSKLQNIRSYNYVKIADREYKFYYTLDTAITNLATKCP